MGEDNHRRVTAQRFAAVAYQRPVKGAGCEAGLRADFREIAESRPIIDQPRRQKRQIDDLLALEDLRRAVEHQALRNAETDGQHGRQQQDFIATIASRGSHQQCQRRQQRRDDKMRWMAQYRQKDEAYRKNRLGGAHLRTERG